MTRRKLSWEAALKALVQAVPPPLAPSYTTGPLIDLSIPTLPDDHAALVLAYGSGEFAYGDIGCVIEVFNPRDHRHVNRRFHSSHDILRKYRESEGGEYMPYSVYPESPGVMVCGWNDSHDYYFWHRNCADPNKWPTVFYGDMQDSREFRMPMVVFIQQLFFSKITRAEFGFGKPSFYPTVFQFRPALLD